MSRVSNGQDSMTLARVVLLFGILAAWFAATEGGLVSPMTFPSPRLVAVGMVNIFTNSDMASHVLVTLSEVALAMLAVIPLGILIGVSLSQNGTIGRALSPLMYFLLSVPKSLFLPTFILFLGITYSEKVAFGVFSSLFILVVSVEAATKSVPHDLVRVAKVYGATPTQLYRKVFVPALLPALVEGFRLAMIFTTTGIVFAEMYAARAGIGQMIAYWGEYFMLPELVAGILVAGAISIVINETLRALEYRLGRWRQN
jgi:ABC-type nitrate/sulfonate/bicarbonate transport system permease component